MSNVFTLWAKPQMAVCCTLPLPFAPAGFGLYPPGTCTERSEQFMNKKLKEIPKFANEAEEREFWLTHDTTDYVDWSKAKRVTFPNLKPTTQSISLRLPLWMLDSIKTTANRQDVPYQSLIKVWLNEKLEESHHGAK